MPLFLAKAVRRHTPTSLLLFAFPTSFRSSVNSGSEGRKQIQCSRSVAQAMSAIVYNLVLPCFNSQKLSLEHFCLVFVFNHTNSVNNASALIVYHRTMVFEEHSDEIDCRMCWSSLHTVIKSSFEIQPLFVRSNLCMISLACSTL